MDLARIQNLCDLLDGHLERYQTLAAYIGQEKKLLLELDLEGMFAASQVKQELALDIQNNIAALVGAISETALMMGLPPEPQPLLADLVRVLPKPYDNRVNDGAVKLERLKNIILRENEANRRFIEEAMRLADETIDILTGAGRLKGDGYNQNGAKGEKKRTLPVRLSREV
ncbi:MAG: flagellar export chaperone FlgN [Candidatus Adiutrix sp.]|jgi:hypothetical protein|nr:flagellar export chaperone FlgN [Candidatus Adiutrix sp.]